MRKRTGSRSSRIAPKSKCVWARTNLPRYISGKFGGAGRSWPSNTKCNGSEFELDAVVPNVFEFRHSSPLRLGPDHFSMSGLAEIGDVEEILGIKMPDGDYNSIGGFMCMTIDRIPVIGEVVMVETAAEMIRFEIASVDDRRVLSVEAFRSGKDGKSDEEAEDDAQEKTPRPLCLCAL